jgi:hypothetical protein
MYRIAGLMLAGTCACALSADHNTLVMLTTHHVPFYLGGFVGSTAILSKLAGVFL